jgi:hypothetical protein
MSISHDELAGIIRELAQIGWLSQTTDNMLDLASDLLPAIANEIRGINTPDRLSELADQIWDFGLYDQRNPDLLMDLFTRSGRIREMALFVYGRPSLTISFPLLSISMPFSIINGTFFMHTRISILTPPFLTPPFLLSINFDV